MSHGCAEWHGDLGAYVIGALEGDERAAMRQHLAACPACRADYEDFLPVRDWLTQTKRHLAACRKCRADYEELLLPGLARYGRLISMEESGAGHASIIRYQGDAALTLGRKGGIPGKVHDS